MQHNDHQTPFPGTLASRQIPRGYVVRDANGQALRTTEPEGAEFWNCRQPCTGLFLRRMATRPMMPARIVSTSRARFASWPGAFHLLF
jgi:hypothetical protein